MAVPSAILDDDLAPTSRFSLLTAIRRNPTIALGGLLLLLLIVMAVFAPLIATADPLKIAPVNRLQGPSVAHFFGTDQLGRDLYSRVVYGTRIAISVAVRCAATRRGWRGWRPLRPVSGQ